MKKANEALNYPDFGNRYSYGTLRNEVSKQAKHRRVLILPKEFPARFILPEWANRPEYSCVQRNDKKGTVGRFDFLSYLERLGWEPFLGVHNLKLSFGVYQLQWLSKDRWKYSPKSRSYSSHLSLSCPVVVQCFDTGTILVSVKCSSRPFRLDPAGLGSLLSLLGEVRNSLHAPCIPDPNTWLVVQWHLNRDSETLEGGGRDTHLTFADFFHDSARFYFKHELNKYRAEVNQSPKRTIQETFERILDRDNISEKGAG